MNKSGILAFISINPVGFIATVEDGKPHVRGILMCWADEDGIVFGTGKMKDFHKQLAANPAVEICYYNLKDNVQVRVSGVVEQEDSIELKKQMAAKFDFLKLWFEQYGYEFYVPYRLRHGRATVWTMAANFEPKTYIDL